MVDIFLIISRSTDYARAIYRKKLRAFEELCELPKYLGETMADLVTAPRAIDFDHKLKRFMQLAP